ncbi:MAG TPA: Na+/H+ antiporter [Gemmatimonadales bacterium]|nr:Na+/H+ antiporter [Gemmatimonadales bacterium]
MHVFEIVITLLLVGAALASAARRIGAPYPALLALAGAALALMPGVPAVMLDPELALALFVAPVLLDAAFDASPRDLRENWRPVASLALVTVALTVAAVAITVRWLVPDIPWFAAIALGAIVAPPDAAAATAVLRQLRPPHRLLVILEGESLFNDASALLIYRLAVRAAAAGAVSGWTVIPTLLAVTAGSIVLGLVLARGTGWVMARIEDVATSVIVQFVGTFGVWIIAERLHLSGILTMVVYAMTVARTAPDVMPARIRIPSYAVWEVAVFLLNALAFILVGLQLKPIIGQLARAELLGYAGIALAVCGVVILVRLVWALGANAVRGPRTPAGRREAVVVGWSGMRGTVTLAAALALPAAFPHRDLILFTSFLVVLGTLVLQGLTLRPLMAWLGIQRDDAVDREVRLARVETIRAGADALANQAADGEAADLLRRKYRVRLEHAEGRMRGEGPGGDARPPVSSTYTSAARAAMEAERRRLSALRAAGTIGDDAFHRVEEELDRAELSAEAMHPEE